MQVKTAIQGEAASTGCGALAHIHSLITVPSLSVTTENDESKMGSSDSMRTEGTQQRANGYATPLCHCPERIAEGDTVQGLTPRANG
jgi:hypothetical protein